MIDNTLLHIDVNKMTKKNGFNPILAINNNLGAFTLAESLTRRDNEPLWNAAKEKLLGAIILYVWKCKEEKTLDSIIETLTGMISRDSIYEAYESLYSGLRKEGELEIAAILNAAIKEIPENAIRTALDEIYYTLININRESLVKRIQQVSDQYAY